MWWKFLLLQKFQLLQNSLKINFDFELFSVCFNNCNTNLPVSIKSLFILYDFLNIFLVKLSLVFFQSIFILFTPGLISRELHHKCYVHSSVYQYLWETNPPIPFWLEVLGHWHLVLNWFFFVQCYRCFKQVLKKLFYEVVLAYLLFLYKKLWFYTLLYVHLRVTVNTLLENV